VAEVKYIVAVKDVSSGNIRPGKKLGQYRTKDFAWHARSNLAREKGLDVWRIGVFYNGKLVE